MHQEQFLDVVDAAEAQRRFHAAVRCDPVGAETVPLSEAWGRVLAEDVQAAVDVPGFDRSDFDGFAVRAADTYGAHDESPRELSLSRQQLATGIVPASELIAGSGMSIATGALLPRGADAVVMVEYADVHGQRLLVRRPVAPGFGVTSTGTDIGSGETVLRRGTLLTSRETGVLSAVGCDPVTVWRRPRVAVISTGNELVAPGQPLPPACIYDSNARIIADAVRELGCQPLTLGIIPDDLEALRQQLTAALAQYDAVLLSGGTSKGTGDLSYRVVRELNDPGVVAHGVALKPGKPLCLAASGGKPVVVLPGFPTSAIFTFHTFVAPVLRRMAGSAAQPPATRTARLAVKVNSDPGRMEFVLVSLVERTAAAAGEPLLAAFPMGKGSGSVTAFSQADGFLTLGRHEELVEAGRTVRVQLIGRDVEVADLVVIGSHCLGVDLLLGRLHDRSWRTRFLAVGSAAGLEAIRRGECDLAGCHLLDPQTGQYNQPFLPPGVVLVRGYRRLQGVVFRRGDHRFDHPDGAAAVAAVRADFNCVMVNRNRGSGTRVLIDQLLAGAQPPGYSLQPRSHYAVAAAVAQGRADWGVAIRSVAERAHLGFLPVADEQYDFAVAGDRLERPAVQAFIQLLREPATRTALEQLGFTLPSMSDVNLPP